MERVCFYFTAETRRRRDDTCIPPRLSVSAVKKNHSFSTERSETPHLLFCFRSFRLPDFRTNYTVTLNNSASFETAVSISFSVLYLLNENRTAPRFEPGYNAPSTCEPVCAPLEHALPPDTEIP